MENERTVNSIDGHQQNINKHQQQIHAKILQFTVFGSGKGCSIFQLHSTSKVFSLHSFDFLALFLARWLLGFLASWPPGLFS